VLIIFTEGVMKRFLVAIVLVLLAPGLSWALATTMEFGVRGVTSEETVSENYTVTEVYYQHALPWKKEISPGMVVYVRLDTGASYMKAADERGGWLALGGDLVLNLLDGMWEIEGGFRPMLFFEHEFGEDDFGGPVQFASHIGTTFYLGDVAFNYRYQHISNGGLYSENPGINLHMVGVGMRF